MVDLADMAGGAADSVGMDWDTTPRVITPRDTRSMPRVVVMLLTPRPFTMVRLVMNRTTQAMVMLP